MCVACNAFFPRTIECLLCVRCLCSYIKLCVIINSVIWRSYLCRYFPHLYISVADDKGLRCIKKVNSWTDPINRMAAWFVKLISDNNINHCWHIFILCVPFSISDNGNFHVRCTRLIPSSQTLFNKYTTNEYIHFCVYGLIKSVLHRTMYNVCITIRIWLCYAFAVVYKQLLEVHKIHSLI